jgi:CheY-like chemotaxis protein
MRTIFYAHDQQESPDSRKHSLELAGYSVRTFGDYVTLEAALKEGPAPDLLLLDVLLEGRNGFEAARTISEAFAERGFPIVLSTHIYRTRPFRDEALRCGAADYLLLPMSPDEFLRRINQAVAYYVPPGRAQAAV